MSVGNCKAAWPSLKAGRLIELRSRVRALHASLAASTPRLLVETSCAFDLHFENFCAWAFARDLLRHTFGRHGRSTRPQPQPNFIILRYYNIPVEITHSCAILSPLLLLEGVDCPNQLPSASTRSASTRTVPFRTKL